MRTLIVTALAFFSASCAGPSVETQQLRITPEQAVFNAANSVDGTTGVFEMVVRETGRQNGLLFLNSERDYRDPRNLTVSLTPEVEGDLAKRLGGSVVEAVKTKTIAVRGTAKTTKIWFNANGRRTSSYYFQTQIELRSARDLTLSGERAFM